MPSAKHNSTMEMATGLIISLLNVASSQDMLFTNFSSYMASIMVLPLSSFVPVLFTDNARCRFAIAQNGFLLAFSEATWIHCREVSYTVICL